MYVVIIIMRALFSSYISAYSVWLILIDCISYGKHFIKLIRCLYFYAFYSIGFWAEKCVIFMSVYENSIRRCWLAVLGCRGFLMANSFKMVLKVGHFFTSPIVFLRVKIASFRFWA